jgi:hypothetical protein
VNGCLLYKNHRLEERIRHDGNLRGLTPNLIRSALIDFVTRRGVGAVSRRVETEQEYLDDPVTYVVVVPIPEIVGSVYVKMILRDSDPEYPVVHIVSVHKQGV